MKPINPMRNQRKLLKKQRKTHEKQRKPNKNIEKPMISLTNLAKTIEKPKINKNFENNQKTKKNNI